MNQRRIWLAAPLVALGLAGCGASASSVCEAICDCTGCSDAELDSCIDDIEDLEGDAADEGCEDQYDEAISCVDEEIECRGSNGVDFDGCESELYDLAQCTNGPIVVGGGNVGVKTPGPAPGEDGPSGGAPGGGSDGETPGTAPD